MEWLLLLVVVLMFVGILAAALKGLAAKAGAYPYVRCGALFTPAERSFFGVLEQAVGNGYYIFAKVRVGDVLETKRGLDARRRQAARNRIDRKHFDFVLCEKGDLSVVCALELDDKSHQNRRRRERDVFLVSACQAASLPLMQVPAQRAYNVAEIRSQVLGALAKPEPSLAPEPASVVARQGEGRIEPTLEAMEAKEPAEGARTSSGSPACPKCAGAMVRRQAKAGAMAGQEFWGCSNFPSCRGILQLSA